MTTSIPRSFVGVIFFGALIASGNAAAVCYPQPECEANNTKPVVALTAPSNGATTTAPGTFVLTATASDSEGTVDAVEFFSNNVSVGIDSTAPYSITLNGLAAGTYVLKAKATDDGGLIGTSSQISVTVTVPANSPPNLTLTSPSNGATATAPATIVISATASDNDGTITNVQFKNGSTVLNTDSSYPYSYSWTGVTAGSYAITAVATDNGGATATSPVANVTVSAASNNPPTVSLTAPTSGTSTATNTAVTLSATAADSDGSVANVKFFANGALISTDSLAPFSGSYQSSTAGTYAITAVATDNAGATTTSSAATLTVTAPGTVSETRTYVYDQNERLCKTINPESGATVIDYDGAGNIVWTADGLNLPSTVNCDRDLVTAAQKTTRTYDAVNRVLAVATPGGTADLATSYFADGKVASLTAANPGGYNVITTYTYNKRRLLTSEAQTNGTTQFVLSYGYTGNGNLSAIGYPDNEIVAYNPDALGRPTAVVGTSATYASGIAYYPNGAMSTFKYGSAAAGGPTHEMTQNARQLPSRSYDYKGTTVILDDRYAYDANGNVSDIADYAQTGAASQTRGMAYDGLDRLTIAVGPWGTGSYTYDALDNLRSANQGTRQYRYNYDPATWRLSLITSPAGATIHSFSYDARGNVTAKNAQDFVFDAANRMSSAETISGATGNQVYRYDGLGRRVQTTDPGTGTPTTFYAYSQAGQILYASEARNSQNLSYIYLNGSQIATRAKKWAPLNTTTVRYQMTDALGSPVASTNTTATAGSIQRTSYTPWGESTPTVDGTGYTGHVSDASTGLVYMQQRYYDSTVGRFLATDPMLTDPNTGAGFNRFFYGANNPFKFLDPDGRANQLGVVANLPPEMEFPTAAQMSVQQAAQQSVDLTVEAAVASADVQAVAEASVWHVTVDPRADVAPQKGGAVETSSSYRGTTVVSVDTFFSNQIKKAADNTGEMTSTGIRSQGSNANLLALGAHELGHADPVTRKMESGYDKEMRASEFAVRIAASSPTVPQGKVQICYECYESP